MKVTLLLETDDGPLHADLNLSHEDLLHPKCFERWIAPSWAAIRSSYLVKTLGPKETDLFLIAERNPNLAKELRGKLG